MKLRTLLLAAALPLSCAEGTLDDLGDAAISGEVVEFDAPPVADDAFALPVDELPLVMDAGLTTPDASSEDRRSATVDAPPSSADDAGASAEDRPTGVVDSPAPRDVSAADVGVSCAPPQTACAGRCVNTAADPRHCGACENSCAASTPVCTGGRCGAPGCGAGASDCDGNSANGCETSHMTQGSCAAAANLGTWCGDVSCGFLCPSNASRVVSTRTGTAGAWFRGRTNECSNCPARLDVTFTLAVPPGVNYDLYVYEACSGSPIGRSVALEGQADRVNIQRSGDFGSDSFDWFVEVRYASGSACMPWTLTVSTRSNSGSDC